MVTFALVVGQHLIGFNFVSTCAIIKLAARHETWVYP